MKPKQTVGTEAEAQEFVEKFFPGQKCPLNGFEKCEALCPAYRGPYYFFNKTARDFVLTPGECSAPILVARNMLISRTN